MSFVKQFAEQEFRRLRGIPISEMTVLVATLATHATPDEASSPSCEIVGTLDMKDNYKLNRIGDEPRVEGSQHSAANGSMDGRTVYLTNVAVKTTHRGSGIGYRLVSDALHRASRDMKASKAYAHVDVQNEIALRLYSKCGFQMVSDDGTATESDALSRIGKRYLLQFNLEPTPST